MAPPGLAWIQTAGHKLASQRTASRLGSFSMSPRADATAPAPITLHILTRLALLVEFLDENHRREEGLYRREGLRMETQDLLEFCLTRDLPDLAVFNPHSIATVIKHCLLYKFEPLVPYAISSQMLEACDDTIEAARGLLMAKFKQINSASREFLKLFLLHLHHLSNTASCRMDAKTLASHIGIALIRPTEEKKRLASRTVKRQREFVAQFLIEQAPLLPYDCATEMELETIPDHSASATKEHQSTTTSCPSESKTSNNPGQSGGSDPPEGSMSFSVQSAEAEEEPLFIRCNDTQEENSDPRTVSDQHEVEDVISLTDALGSSSSRRGSIVVEDYESDVSGSVPTHLHTAAKSPTTGVPAIFDHVQPDPRARPASPIPGIGDNIVEDPSLSPIEHQDTRVAFAEKRSAELGSVSDQVRAKSVGKLASRGNQAPRLGLIKNKSGFMTEVRGILARRRSKPDSVQRANLKQEHEGVQIKTSDLVKASDVTKDAMTQTMASVESDGWTTEHHGRNQCDHSTQTSTPTAVLAVDEGTNTDGPARKERCNVEHATEGLLPEVQELVERKLMDMQTLLTTADAALFGTPSFSETSRSLHQLHTQALAMISDALAVLKTSQTSNGGADTSSGNALLQTNKEFLDFLEVQSKTQVKILEVEVKAGQELMRLLKAQHQQERTELEQEKEALQITRTETERLSAELRTELRKCRNELTCQAAYTTRLSREKRDIEERLATSETHRQAREIALARAKEELAEMKKVTADEQARVQSVSITLATGSSNEDNQRESAMGHCSSLRPALPSKYKGDRAAEANAVLRAERFLTTARQRSTSGTQHVQRRQQVQHRESSLEVFDRARASYHEKATTTNAMALERLKRKMAKDIQDQIAVTKRALDEMEDCGLDEPSFEADQVELRSLQEELGTRTAVVDETMEESRRQLAQLLSGSQPPSFAKATPSNLYGWQTDPIATRPWSSTSAGLLHELAQLVEHEPASVDDRSDTRNPDSATSFEDDRIDDWQVLKSARIPQQVREPQSQTYKRWVAQRSKKAAEFPRHRDRRSAEQALASMKTFKQTLAALQADECSWRKL